MYFFTIFGCFQRFFQRLLSLESKGEHETYTSLFTLNFWLQDAHEITGSIGIVFLYDLGELYGISASVNLLHTFFDLAHIHLPQPLIGLLKDLLVEVP